MSTQVERIVLYMVVLALAVAVGYLAYKINGGDCASCGELDRRLTEIETTMDSLEKNVDAVKEIASGVDALISAHNDQTESTLKDINAAVASKIADGLAGLEERIANAVVNKLPAGCPTPKPGGECDRSESLPPATSKFTLLYENARLTENSEITEDSFGVKLEPWHLKHLELLTKAFVPCHRSDDPVEFRVTGYASSAEFRFQPSGDPMPNSDELNRKTANLRAQIVGDHLRNHGFNVATKQWASTEHLQRPYLDDAPPETDQQALNRTVLIRPAKAGTCDVRHGSS